MKFRVSGSNRESGARMTLEFVADSRAAAERKACNCGMSVNKVQELTPEADPDKPPRRKRSAGSGMARYFLLLLIALTVAAWYYWTHIRQA